MTRIAPVTAVVLALLAAGLARSPGGERGAQRLKGLIQERGQAAATAGADPPLARHVECGDGERSRGVQRGGHQ
ncbi:MAG: hypothetical protein M3N47_07565, partial [Chloroflexota bacterium]|nr:hypothetical protein [Chloroflexota bacterium]